MLISQKVLLVCGHLLVLWMIINTFITDSLGIALVLSALIIGGLQYVRIAPVHSSKISESIESLFKVDHKNHVKNTIFHKGGGYHAPENTLEAVHQAIALGVPAVEIDLEITSDGVGVLIHGPELAPTTDGTGRISKVTHDYIKTLNAAANDPNKDKFPVARIPTIDECIRLCIDNSLIVFIDCKSDAQRTAKLIAELYQKYPELYGLGVVCSFYPHLIYSVRQADANIITAVTHRSFYISLAGEDGEERNKELWKRVLAPFADAVLEWAHNGLIWFLCGNSFFLCSRNKISKDSKAFYQSLGVRLVAWTVNEPIEKQFLVDHLGIPVITDGLNTPSAIPRQGEATA
ncbi:glycerophosphodiester phosphodiesterase 1 [Elysia marginata]|uniref:Glycerophosphodiester phosphodiesterase 1 n=1 Tax=Elysia marginata TaxID=1093978 RepID=A0AAV4H0W7_9GAST|nr:glycerophosphodiester phosphodiesterase 1 [Elysia marginata]